MADIIPFPKNKPEGNINIPEPDPIFEKATNSVEKRLGVTIWEYFGFEGDPTSVQKKIDRSMQKESMIIRTRAAEDPEY